MVMTALISVVHGMTHSVTLPVTTLATEFAYLNGKAIIVQSLSAYLDVVRNMVIVRPPVSASALSGGRAPAVMNAYFTQGAYMAPANNPFSALVRRDGVACFATRILMSEFIYLVLSWLSDLIRNCLLCLRNHLKKILFL